MFYNGLNAGKLYVQDESIASQYRTIVPVYISAKRILGGGVSCYMAVISDGFE
jgi:hypothetical protein